MITVTKTFTFDAAHILPWYKGPCCNLHGHTYHLEVTVKKAAPFPLPDYFVIDFAVLKQIVQQQVINSYDHAVIFSADVMKSQQEHQLMLLAKEWSWTFVQLKVPTKLKNSTTCENILEDIYHRLADELLASGLKIVKLKLYETPTSFAEIIPEV